MGSRFGAVNPRREKNKKLKIILGSVVFLLVILLLVLIWILQTQQTVVGAVPVTTIETKIQSDLGTVPVLIPLFRIEAGTKLADEMFKTKYIPKVELPQNAIIGKDKIIVRDKYSSRLLNANILLTKDDLTETEPFDLLQIPVGYRLITIIVDNRSGVEGFAKPGARVDVLWTFIQNGEKKITTLAKFVKVVSLAGDATIKSDGSRTQVAADKKATISLLVTEKQAKYLELARSSGDLSLVLLGGENVPSDIDATPEILSESGIKGNPKVSIEEPEHDGTMIIGNKTYVLKNNKWKLEK